MCDSDLEREFKVQIESIRGDLSSFSQVHIGIRPEPIKEPDFNSRNEPNNREVSLTMQGQGYLWRASPHH